MEDHKFLTEKVHDGIATTEQVDQYFRKESKNIKEEELWSLDLTIAHFIGPRLRAFIDRHSDDGTIFEGENGETWKEVLEEIYFAICYNSHLSYFTEETKEEREVNSLRAEKGMDYFKKYWSALWT